MPKYKVRLDCGKTREVEADVVNLDPIWVAFYTRASAGNPQVMKAVFPAKSVVEVLSDN